MAVHQHNSWGRTRSPKNLAGANGTEVTMTATDGSEAALVGITASTAGYATENQRYLHVLVEDANTGTEGAVSVYGYCHAFLRWFEIPVVDLYSANAAPTVAAIAAPPDTGNAPALDVPSEREYRVYHIVGIDRVAFIGAQAGVNVFAACSTF
tara:strand:- start:150 stop:608 length:459 start_codon:yes stop_codon:yes gene_type:complete